MHCRSVEGLSWCCTALWRTLLDSGFHQALEFGCCPSSTAAPALQLRGLVLRNPVPTHTRRWHAHFSCWSPHAAPLLGIGGMWRALKAPYSGRPAETGSPGVRPAIPTRDNSGLRQIDPSRALSCQLVQRLFHPFY